MVPKYFNENIIECTIHNDNFDCTSDHYPIKTVVRFMNDFAMNSETCTSVSSHPKPDWNNENFIETYISNITQLTSVVDTKFLQVNKSRDKGEIQNLLMYIVEL